MSLGFKDIGKNKNLELDSNYDLIISDPELFFTVHMD